MKKKYIIWTLFFISINSFSQITDTQVIDNANTYLNHNWTANSNNIWNDINCGGKTVNTPNWVTVGSHTSLPYCWGGNSTVAAFDNYLTQGKSAGDDNTDVGFGAEPACSVGVDCSGYVSRCYGLSTHYSTTVLNTNTLFGHYSTYNDLKVGDFVNKPGSHTRLVTQINNNGTITFLESGSGTGNVGSAGLWKVFQWTYSVATLINEGYNPQYYTNMTSNNGGTPPNDTCSDAINLQSNQTCTYTSGTVNGATDDGITVPSCDNLSNPPKGVWYTFTPSAITHTITISPNSTMNAVLAVYSGTTCNNLIEIECDGAASGGSGNELVVTYTAYNIGQTYWIRVYDYGNVDPTNGSFDICITASNSGGPEDIFLTNAHVTPTTLEVGDTLDMSIDQNYSGTSNSVPDVYLYYYLSEDCNIDGNDLLIYDEEYSTIDEGNTSESENHSFDIPTGTPAGTYYILFQADATNVVTEDNENNNLACIEITVTETSGGEDIFLTNAHVTPTILEAGDTVDMNINQNYSGTSSSVPDVYLYYYLSEDCNIDGADLLIYDEEYSTIDEGNTSESESHSFEIPTGTLAGTYYILFQADATNVVNEDNENNNIACIEIEVEETLGSIQPPLNKTIKVFPNPATHVLNWTAANLNISDIKIFSALGQQMVCAVDTKNRTVNVSSLANGIYFAKFSSLEKDTITLKIVKE